MNQSNSNPLHSRLLKGPKWFPVLAVASVALALSGCGSSKSSSSTASVRVANATLTHASLDLWVNGAVAASGTTSDAVSTYAVPASGGATLQIDDAGSSTALSTSTPTLTGASHYTLVAYESGTSVKSVLLPEDWAVPAAGAASLRVYDIATDAGKLDVYIGTTPITAASDLTSMSPAWTFAASTSASVAPLTYSKGTYYVSVTAASNPNDLRMVNMPVTLADMEVASVLLTPASGSMLLNGSLLVQQGAYSAFRNTNSRVRLASAVSVNTNVTATVKTGSNSVTLPGSGVAPQFGRYVLAPAGSTLNITVGGTAVAAPATPLVTGGDMTLLVYGTPGAATASLVADDNRPPSDATTVKLRVINGITGNVNNGITMTANSAFVAGPILPGTASSYASVPASLNPMILMFNSTEVGGIYFRNSDWVFNANSVYSVLVYGDFAGYAASPQQLPQLLLP